MIFRNWFIVLTILISPAKASSQVIDPVDWKFNSEKVKGDEVDLIFTAFVEKPWHIYAQEPNGGMTPTVFSIESSEYFEKVGQVNEPSDYVEKYDSIFKVNVRLFKDKVVFKQRIKTLTNNSFNVKGIVEYFSCDDERCLPPEEEEFSINVNNGSSMQGREPINQSVEENSSTEIKEKPSFQFEETGDKENVVVTKKSEDKPDIKTANDKRKMEDRGLLGLFLISILGGFGALLTPCVYPIIPLTVSFFMRGDKNKKHAILNGILFGISIIVIYTSVGLLAGILKVDLTSSLATHWLANLIFFLLFILFAMSFFGLFEFVLPSAWANKIDSKADKGGFLGPFFMALATVIISFSCTGPIVGVLLGKSLQGEIIKPVVGMFGFSLAFSLPFTLLAIFPGMMKTLPKSGGWMNAVKVVFAFILLAFSLKFLSNIDQAYHLNVFGRPLYLSLWIAIFMLLGLYLIGKIKFSHDTDVSYIPVPRLLLAILSFAFMFYLIPGLFGAELSSLSSLLPPQKGNYYSFMPRQEGILQEENKYVSQLCDEPKYGDFLELPHNLKGYFDYEEGMKCAKQLNKPIFLDFKGHVCTNCKEMEAKVWSHPEVLKRLHEDYLIIALYTDDKTRLPKDEWIKSEVDGKIKKTIGKINSNFQIEKYNTNSIPFYALVDHNGKLLNSPKGHDLNINSFIQFLDEGLEAFKKRNNN